MNTRSVWTALTDAELLHQCEIDTYRASGPGGQKRNKTSSAVRIRHLPSGVMAIAEESRSQHENKARALRRLRKRMYLTMREPFSDKWPNRGVEDSAPAPKKTGLKMGTKDERFWPTVGLVLDALEAHEGRVSEAAAALGVSTGNLIDFLSKEPKVWEQANNIRKAFGHKLLRQ